MAHSDIKAIFLATEDRPMAPLFGSNLIVQGKRILVSALGANFDRVDVLQALRELILDQNQLIVWKTAASEPLTLDVMNFEEIEAAIQFKAPNESSTILGDSLGEYNNLKAQYLSAINDQEQDGVLFEIKKLCFDATLENLASNALKGFGSFMHEPSGTRVFLLDNRKLYSFDQSRIRNISTAISMENARAAQIASQDEAKRSAEKPKASKRKSKKQPKASPLQRRKKSRNFCVMHLVHQFPIHVKARIRILKMIIDKTGLSHRLWRLSLRIDFLLLRFLMRDLFFHLNKLKWMLLRQKRKRRTSRKSIRKRSGSREFRNLKNLLRGIKERELRSIKSTLLVTDPVLRHLKTQTKVLLQKNLLRKRIQVLSRYFNFEIIGFCVVPTI